MNDITKEAFSWVGTPYHSMARVKGVGVDCGQLLIGIYESTGRIGHIETGSYSPEWHLHHSEEKYLEWVERYCDRLPDGATIEEGDILLYQYGRCISHGAIYVGGGQVVHAYVGQGVIVSPIDDCLFFDKVGRPRYRGAYRFRG